MHLMRQSINELQKTYLMIDFILFAGSFGLLWNQKMLTLKPKWSLDVILEISDRLKNTCFDNVLNFFNPIIFIPLKRDMSNLETDLEPNQKSDGIIGISNPKNPNSMICLIPFCLKFMRWWCMVKLPLGEENSLLS